MSWLAKFFSPHTVSVRAYAGRTGTGYSYETSRDVACEVKDEKRMVRDANGAEVVSSTQVTVSLDEVIPLRSLVTVWPGVQGATREAEVIAIERHDNRDTPGLRSHQVLSLK